MRGSLGEIWYSQSYSTPVAAALEVGKIKNKVLKLTGIVQVAQIDVS
jgi:hypothetical protein